MAIDRIQIARDQAAATEAADLLALNRDARSVYERAVRIRDKMRHAFDTGPDPDDWSELETRWGVPAGKGVDVFTFLDGMVLAMEGGQQNDRFKVFTEQVG